MEFSKSKTDEHYGAKCIEQMLEIYINPDNNVMLIDLESPLSQNSKGSDGLLNYNTNDLKLEAIQFLMKELTIRRNDDRTLVFDAYVCMILKDKELIEAACSKLQEIVSKDEENISACVALAMGNLLTMKYNEVKANLKIIEKNSMNIKYYNDFERGLLINAYLNMITDNTKKAEEIITRIINEINIAQSNIFF
jgi:hypothetical protein